MKKIKLNILLAFLIPFYSLQFSLHPLVRILKKRRKAMKNPLISVEILHIQPAETSTPTPMPASRLKEADDAFFAGDLDLAQQLYQQSYDQTDRC